MNKYTIKNIFERRFSFPVWKIEVDCATEHLAVEYRDPDSTLPYFSVIHFDGSSKSNDIQVEEKEWSLESIQKDYLILKRFGSSSPIEAGVRIIHYPTGQTICDYREYVLVEVFEGTVLVKHRSIPDGLLYGIDIASGEVTLMTQNHSLHYPPIQIKYPVAYGGHKPSFITQIPFVEHIWLLPYGEHFLWAYHLENGGKYDLHLQVSSRTATIADKIVLESLDRLIPQPFFTVQGHIFFLSNCKLKIKGYLV